MRTALKAFIVSLMALSLLLGCTRMDLAYRNLDLIIPWSLNDYLGLNSAQKDWLNARLKQHLSWHCSTQLPGYLSWLDRLQQMVETRQVSQEELQLRTNEAKDAISQISRQITPSAVELLAQLDDKQVQEMQEAFAKDMRKHQQEFLEQSLPVQIEERAKRMEKRLSPWIGRLNPSQWERVKSWSAALGEQNRAWLDNRAHWQALFIKTVQARHSADFAERIGKLLQDRHTFWTPQYRVAYEHTEQATIALLVDVVAANTPAQQQRLLEKIADMREDFTNLHCLKTALSGG